MKQLSPTLQNFPLDIVGSTAFGRYPKISSEQTFNMIISDGWLIPYAGHNRVVSISNSDVGRGNHTSTRFNHMISVIGNGVYISDVNLNTSKIAEIDTFSGDVFISENNADQIAICDKQNIYIYNFSTQTFQKASLDFVPGYITFQDGYFIAPASGTNQWRLSDPNNGLSWPDDAPNVGEIETKTDYAAAAVRFPGKGNLLLVFGNTVTEPWYDVGAQLFPFQRSTYFNMDYGCLNPATIAWEENIVVWLGANEKSGPVLMFSDGSDPQPISTDGINFRFANLVNPKNSFAFMFKQDGKLFYQISFIDPQDNLSLTYDFNEKKFYTICDENMNFSIIRQVAFFNNAYYFVSAVDGNIYELSSKFTTYNGKEIPRIRICKNFRMPDSSRFVVNNLTFTIEQGDDSDIQRIDLTISKNGGESFGNPYSNTLNRFSKRQNRLNFWNLGMANDFVPQFRFWGKGRFVCTSGVGSYYQ